MNQNSTTMVPPTPFMKFEDLYVFSGYLNNAGICMNTNMFGTTSTYVVSSVAQSWFSVAAYAPFQPNIIRFDSGVAFTSLGIGYTSDVSSQTSTWNQRVVETGIGDAMFAWLTKQPFVLAAIPYIASCIPVSAAGAPQLHIPVSFLTSSTAVTSTTNAMYFNAAATTSALPASKTLPSVTNTKAPTSNVPSPTTVEVSAETASGVPAQPAESQEAGVSSAIASVGPENQPTQPTTVQGAGASSNQPATSVTEGASSNEPSQQHAQSTVTQNTAPSSAAPADESTDKPTQPATSQGAPSITEGLPSDKSSQQPA
ncbi:hypothetical protein KCU67_g9428, partial [Aureobasidium melanogenum]